MTLNGKLTLNMKLKRFSAARQDQIEQLVAYAELLGLSGEDLVAIGGKIQRDRARVQRIANMEIVHGFECLPIGRDTVNEFSIRFKLKTINGAYNFENIDGWNYWEVTSLKTKMRKTHRVDLYNYELPKAHHYARSRNALLLDIAGGKFSLDF